MRVLISLVLIYSTSAVLAKTHEDLIKALPGWDRKINFKQYSGYLNVSEDKFLHYWFVESQKTPARDPVLLWLNGGPGCSSLLGYISELGPFRINEDGKTLSKNKYSWNKVANVIFLETPAGVGFSYSVSNNVTADDDTVAEDNYIALQRFFEKFPRFKKNEFYIAGESYAGVYIPTLSVKILDGKSDINFKGFAIGNGSVDRKMVLDSVFFFAYYHGFMGDKLWEKLTKQCCKGTPSKTNCDFYRNPSYECRKESAKITPLIQNVKMNLYNMMKKCANSADNTSRYAVDRMNLLELLQEFDDVDSKEVLVESPGVFDDKLEGSPCLDRRAYKKYLNQRAVKDELHISDKAEEWEHCNSVIFQEEYTKIYDTMKPQVMKLINSGKLRGMIFAGDVDMVCSFLASQWFTVGLNLKIVKAYRTWEHDKQIGGWVIDYKNLTFLTVKGSGHMVPEDRPGPALTMITKFLKNKQL